MNYTYFTLKMQTFSRDYLRTLPEKRRRDAIEQAVQGLYSQVIQAATSGKMFHIIDIGHIEKMRTVRPHCHPPPYIPTNDELVEGFKAKFPDCHVEYAEIWEDVRPGVREQKSGILVDWS